MPTRNSKKRTLSQSNNSNKKKKLELKYVIASNNNEHWVSASRIKNHLLGDPVLDYYKLKYSNSKSIPRENILYKMGYKFEDNVVNFLKSKFEGKYKIVSMDKTDINESNSDITHKHILNGVPIIIQGVLYDNDNKTFGCADLIVRSDYVNKIIESKPITEEKLKAPRLKGNYHYIVIDIKWTTMNLCSNGINIRNSGRFPAYKGQLAIYNSIVGKMQGYVSPYAYILAKSWKYIRCREEFYGYNCFDKLGVIDYSNFDSVFLDKTNDAIEWIEKVSNNYNKWDIYNPVIPELYPNMKNSYNDGFDKIKYKHAHTLKELTCLWNVGPKNRKIGHSNSVYRYDDKNCNSKTLGINGEKTSIVLDELIKINKNNNERIIMPKTITNNIYNWQDKLDIEFYIDFETLNTQFYTEEINLFDSRSITNLIFMIGVGYIENNDFKYKCFYSEMPTIEEEIRIFKEFMNFIDFKVNEHMNEFKIKDRSLCTPRFFHWANAEISIMKSLDKRCSLNIMEWLKRIQCIDFCKVFKDEPIVIKGVFGFGLKDIAKEMYKNGFISTKWKSATGDGLEASLNACKYYKFSDSLRNAKLTRKTIELKEYYDKYFEDIISYNETDCKVVWDIVNYFRKKHIKIDGNINSYPECLVTEDI